MNVEDQLELIFNENNDEITLKPVRKPRDGWSASFKKMHAKGHDELLIDDLIDLNDWEW